MDYLKKFKYIFLIFLVSGVATGAYLDEISVLIGGSAPSATNSLPVRMSDGTAFYDARQIRALTATDVVTANIGTAGTIATAANQTTQTTALNSIDAGVPAALGQNTMANSMSVALASNQSAIPVTDNSGSLTVDAVSWPLPTNAATDRTTAAAPYSNRLSDGTDFLQAFDMDNTGTVSKILGVTIRGLANGTPVELGTTANPLRVDPTGTTAQPVTNAGITSIDTDIDVALSTRASAANQVTTNSTLSTISTTLSDILTKFTDGLQRTKITDGTNNAAVTNSDPAATDFGLAVREVGRAPDSYSATVVNLAPAATPTDVFTITGSATRVIKIRRIIVSGTKTASSHDIVRLIRRSTANTGGTSTVLTNVPMDTNNAASTATVRSYTANPTLGTAVGTLLAKRVNFNVQTPANAQGVAGGVQFDERFGDASEGIYLRGVTQVLAVNLNAVTLTGASLTITVEWNEE